MIASGRAHYANEQRGGESLRSYRAPLAAIGSGPAAGGAVLVATSTEADERTAHRIRVLVLLAAAGAAVLAIGIALLLTRRALRPLTDLSAAAREIGETGDPTRRLPPAGAGDEVGALSETLNAMLASLERAREAERRFVADASHELRTPLTALRGNAAYIAQHGANARGAERSRERRQAARAPARRPPRARTRGRGRAVVVPSPCASIVSRSRARARGSTVDAPSPVTVRGDADALARAIGNLVENALVHGPAGRGRAASQVREEAGRARLTVTDQGAGPERGATPSTRSSGSGAPPSPTPRPARASVSRSCARRRSATAEACRSPARRSRSSCRAALSVLTSSQRALRQRG